jgi:hypothetical protein
MRFVGRPQGDWLSIIALRCCAQAFVLAAGFSAISDDDFARVAIAQGFAFEPRLDPSGSSWLPFPFWLSGGVMTLFGTSIDVARALTWFTSAGSALLVYVAARWCAFDRRSAWLGAALSAILPHAVWLGAATVPDGYCAALCLFAVATSTSFHPSRRWWGALAIFCAALSRYEAWPVAALLAVLGVWDAFVQQRRALLWPALATLLAPLAWLVHGAVQHGDAFFFLQRVAEYRRALGRSPETLLSGLLGYPKVLLRAEPELLVAALLALLPIAGRPFPRHSKRLLLASAALLGFLILGDLGDGAPTHHPERPLLMLWLVLCLFAGHALLSLWLKRRRWLYIAALAACIGFLLRPIVTRRDSFIQRDAELAIGAASRNLVGNEPLLIDSDDYGFFAVMVGFERPQQAQAFIEPDPRRPRANPWTTRAALAQHLRETHAQWLIVQTRKLPQLQGFGLVELSSEGYALVRLNGPPTSP